MTESSPVEFSICTLYRNPSIYNHLVKELKLCDFDHGVEYLSIYNHDNEWDCYEAIRYFISNARGEYVLICHDDILPHGNTKAALQEELSNILLKDPKAALFGVAGQAQLLRSGSGHFFSSQGREYWGFEEEAKVSSLDECFLIIRRESGVTVSQGLDGFHFYGTDLCLNAEKLGYSSYVIDFPIFHRSEGKLDSNFYEARDRFEKHLEQIEFHRFVRTTCTIFYGGSSRVLKAWALAKSLIIIRSSRHRDLKITGMEIRKRGKGHAGIFFPIFILIITLAHALESLPEVMRVFYWSSLHNPLAPFRRIGTDVLWWVKNWHSRL